jgi:hypothetical protein
MKTINKLSIIAFTMLLLFSTSNFAQEEMKRPMYVVATTLHWNMDYDGDGDWKAIEKEYMDKVTKKNEHIMSARFYTHLLTENSTELMYVQTFATWEDIDKAGDRDAELAKEAWPDETERKAFLKSQNAFYSSQHSDEIYSTLSGAKNMTEAPTKDMILYLRKSHLAFPEDGTMDEYSALSKEFQENVIMKNDYIKGYYPNRHVWGADGTEFVEAFLLDSLDDLNDMLKRNGELIREHWADEDKRKEFWENSNKYFTGVHGDYVYTMVHGISE